jgi:TRAP-type C4-dicarboxylate transport system permease large subunit
MLRLKQNTVAKTVTGNKARHGEENRARGALSQWQFLALFVATIGGIYAGVFSPTEATSFVIQAQAPDIKLTSLYCAILPFLIAPFILVGLLFLFPQLALWLPKALYGS